MIYKFLKLMNNSEFKTMLVNYGNNTGAEINNYVIRQLISIRDIDACHPILEQMNEHIRINSISLIRNEIKGMLNRDDFLISEDMLVDIIRENKNNIFFDKSKELNHTQFLGICKNHGHIAFRRTSKHYFCFQCHDECSNKIIYKPLRNLILKLFIDLNDLSYFMVADDLNISHHTMYGNYNFKSSVTDDNWFKIEKLIKKVGENVESN